VDVAEELILRLLESTVRLKRLPRTGWLLAGVIQPESVAEHTCATALLALELAHAINRAPGEQGLDAPVDVGRVAQVALVHDLAEALLTDLPRRATALLGEAVKHDAEERALIALLGASEDAESYLALWREYDRGATPEARLVRDADKLEMVYQAYSYEVAGHRQLDEFWEGHRWYYPISAHVFASLRRARPGCV
jgi:putative hydrolase of HD superfamily